MARISRHQIEKSAGLTLVMVRRIMEVYSYARPTTPEKPWELAIGTAIVVAFKVFARWDDGAQLRWEDSVGRDSTKI